MKKQTLVRIAGQSIVKNKMRTLLTMLGIVIGVGAVIVMVAVGHGAQSTIEQQIGNLGTNLIMVTAGSSQQGGVSQGAQTFNRLTVDDAEKLSREATLVAGVSPVINSRGQVIGGEGNWRTSIQGVSTAYPVIRGWQTSSGDFFTDADLNAKRKVVLLGATVAANLFPGQDPVGQQVQVRSVPMTVVGVMAAKGQTASGNDMDDVVLLPYTTMQARLSGGMFIGQILASTASAGEIPAAQEEIRAIMRESHRQGDGEADDFTIRNQNEL
ncbi:MAG: ABC transporter permease, partial [Longimicrobiaceae bacterium]